MKTVLEARNISKHYSGITAVDGVSFSMESGECLGLVGESGCGKSTIAGIITATLSLSGGEVNILGETVIRKGMMRREKICGNVQMVFQNPANSFNPRKSVLYSVIEPLYHQKKTADEKRVLAEEAMNQVGLNRSVLHKYPWELSGGECQRAALARAIIHRPKLLICDEATSALDVSVQAQILQLIKILQRELGMAVLFISHDIALVCGLCDSIAVMNRGKIIEKETTEVILSHPMQEYTKLLLRTGGHAVS